MRICCVVAAEFDIKQGCIVKSSYPNTLPIDENVLAQYMIPDGSQRLEKDISIFRIKAVEQYSTDIALSKLNEANINVKLYKRLSSEQNWQVY